MMGVLAEIVENKKREVDALLASGSPSLHDLGRAPLDAYAALSRSIGAPLGLITEIKFKSPSAGELSRKLDAAQRAICYARGGAAMVSVLCDRLFFGGSYDDLAAARAALDAENLATPLLCKEFVLDEIQLDWARARGADAVLLIVKILARDALGRLVKAAFSRGLEPLVEAASEQELEAALATKARLIGINARNLDSLELDRNACTALVETIPHDRIALYLSGVRNESDIEAIARGRADAALIGEKLMRADDPSELLKRFTDAAFV
jgi:indole-3-glycerol phosphate synthase